MSIEKKRAQKMAGSEEIELPSRSFYFFCFSQKFSKNNHDNIFTTGLMSKAIDKHLFPENNGPMNQNNLATKDDLKTEFIQFEKRFETKIVEIVNNIVNEAVDKLAVAVAKGFEETATKEELKAVENRLGKRLENVEEEVKEVKSQIIFRKDDVRNLKADTPSLSQYNPPSRNSLRLSRIRPKDEELFSASAGFQLQTKRIVDSPTVRSWELQ